MEYDKQIRYNDSQMERYQAYIFKVQKIKRLDKRTKEMTIEDVIKINSATDIYGILVLDDKNNYESQRTDGLVLVDIYCRITIWNT